MHTWINKHLYPFEQRYISLKEGKMHYIDEGKGDIILFVHGTPTWSFLYRDFVKALSKTNRCIAIDHLGFGLSEKNKDFDGSPEWHAHNLNEFIERLDLKEITLVVHDFGGPIGLGAGLMTPNRIKNIVLFNTWLWETKSNPEVIKINKIINSSMGKFLYLRMNFSTKVLLKKGYHDKSKLTKPIHKHYTSPFSTKQERFAPLRIGQALLGSSDWYKGQWEKLHLLEDKNWNIIWGMKDTFITPEYLNKWTNRLPNAKVTKLDTGHFVQEEETNTAIKILHSIIPAKPKSNNQ